MAKPHETGSARRRRPTQTAAQPRGKRLPDEPPEPAPVKGTITAISLPGDLLELLRIVAVKRARGGGRPSVSAVLVDLALRHRDELEEEATGGREHNR